MGDVRSSSLPFWVIRPLSLGLALMSAKTIMVAGHSKVLMNSPLIMPALMHDHLLVVVLFLFIDLFIVLRARRTGPEGEAVGHRAMWCVYALALSWVALSLPIAAALGAPGTIAEMRQAGGVIALVVQGLSVPSMLGLCLVLALGGVAPLKLRRWPSRRVLIPALLLALVITILGPSGRDALELSGLERDPFAVVIQGIWQGLQSIGTPE